MAFNTWKGSTAPPAPADALGIRHYTVVPPDEAELQKMVERVKSAGLSIEETAEGVLVYDPSHVGVMLVKQMLPLKQS